MKSCMSVRLFNPDGYRKLSSRKIFNHRKFAATRHALSCARASADTYLRHMGLISIHIRRRTEMTYAYYHYYEYCYVNNTV